MKSTAHMNAKRTWNVTRPVRAAVLGLGLAASMAFATPAMATTARRGMVAARQASAHAANGAAATAFGAVGANALRQAGLGQALGLANAGGNGGGFAVGMDMSLGMAFGRQGVGAATQAPSFQQGAGSGRQGAVDGAWPAGLRQGTSGDRGAESNMQQAAFGSQQGQTAYRMYNPATGTVMQTGSPFVRDVMRGSGWSVDMGTTRQAPNVPGMNVGRDGEGFGQGVLPGFGQVPATPSQPTDPATSDRPTDDSAIGDATADGTTSTGDSTTVDGSPTTTTGTTTAPDPIDIPAASGTITFTDEGIGIGDGVSGAKAEGTSLTIQKAGSYVVTGSCAEGSIKVKKGVTDVYLTLENLDLSCSTTAPLAVNKGAGAVVDVEGTVTLADNEDATTEDTNEDFEGAAIKVKGLNDDTGTSGELTITGTGTLNLKGNAKNGIKGASGATVTVAGATLNVTAANNGIACDNVVDLTGGAVNVTAGNDGIKAEADEGDTASAGIVNLAGSVVDIDATGEGVQATGDLNVSAGSVTAKAGDKGLKSDVNVNVTGGSVDVNASGDGIHSNDSVTLAAGSVTVASGDDGVHADNVLAVCDGSLTVIKSYEGLEGTTIDIKGGDIKVTSSDDGINAANKNRAFGGSFAINVLGGTAYVNAGGDGLDSNGNITTSGGTVEVFGAANNGNGAMDVGDGGNYGWTANGGTVLAVGMSGMAVAPSSGTSVVFGAAGGMGGQPGQMGRQGSMGSVSIGAGSSIVVSDASGNVVYSATGVKGADHVVFASADLVSGQTYTLSVDGRSVATVTAGTNAGMGGQMGGGQPGQTAQQQGVQFGQGGSRQGGGQMGQTGQQQGGQGQMGGFGQQQGGQMGGRMGR